MMNLFIISVYFFKTICYLIFNKNLNSWKVTMTFSMSTCLSEFWYFKRMILLTVFFHTKSKVSFVFGINEVVRKILLQKF